MAGLTNKLTDSKVRSVKPSDKAQKLFDGGSLYLFVSPTGAKVWRMAYRVNGKAQTAVIGPYPAEHRPDRPISENAVLALLYRMGYKGKMTGHGFRSVGSTWANEAGYPPDVIERQLAHVPGDKTRAVYNRAQYADQRRAMLTAWSAWLNGQA